MLKSLWERHRGILLGTVVVLGVGTGSYALGRYGTAEKVVVQDKVVTVEVEKVVEKQVDKIVYKQVHDTTEKKVVHRVKHELKRADGSTETTTTTDVGDDKASHEATVKYVDRVVEREVVKYGTRETSHNVSIDKPLPDWRIHVLGGLNGPELSGLLKTGPFDPLKHLSVGAQVERRLWGPLTGGVWGLSSGQFGLSLGIEF